MEQRSLLRNLIVGLVMIGVVVLFILMVIRIFSGHGGGPAPKQVNLGSYVGTGSEATLLIDAPTKIDQDHRQVRIKVNANETQVEIIQGYQNNIINSASFSNNEQSYAAFLQSLKQVNFTKGNTKSTADYRGYCPSGNRFVYSFNDGSKDLFKYWSTSCGQGTYEGARLSTRQLFQRQIPTADFNKLTSSIPLN